MVEEALRVVALSLSVARPEMVWVPMGRIREVMKGEAESVTMSVAVLVNWTEVTLPS